MRCKWYSLAVAIRSGIAKYMNVETEEIGCLAYCYAENIFPFDADIDEQVAKIGQWLPNVSGDTYPTRIFYTKSK